jgi:hypothetical protein
MADPQDWRLTGQERYLKGVPLSHRAYRPYPKNPTWDHDHCEFCAATFSLRPDPTFLKAGYCTLDEYHWICNKCFLDFKGLFKWIVVPILPSAP